MQFFRVTDIQEQRERNYRCAFVSKLTYTMYIDEMKNFRTVPYYRTKHPDHFSIICTCNNNEFHLAQ